ncbi:MAG: Eco57I restriction-modification methylase domain-containing protein [Caldilineaceae bacterium]|nr:Eco57I restriction-modification methylase domain-containing protein [Caldilineaceae bacterium]HRJ40471.1 Eco57I restriction-modification methylase domain-containing protein [Caldilineaceae bacterium]
MPLSPAFALLESERLRLQERLDAAKSQAERNRLGQFATPGPLAEEIIQATLPLLSPKQSIRFADPAFGTGSFYSALLRLAGPNQIERASGYEIDPHYGAPAISLWQDTQLALSLADFTRQPLPASEEGQFNLLICNPPYVRHHHIPAEEKERLRLLAKQQTGVALSGLAGLYCYFMLLADRWMASGAVACWLIPSEFLDVNYGSALKRYLLEQVTLLRIHRFDPTVVQFKDALVSSVVVWLCKKPPPLNQTVTFSYGATLGNPPISVAVTKEELQAQPKWSVYGHPSQNGTAIDRDGKLRLADLFSIKRGIATGANNFFILTPQQITNAQLPARFLKPILPSPRYLSSTEILADGQGLPLLEKRLFLLDCDLPESTVQARFPHLWRYLQKGVEKGIAERYLCRHRSPWYSQESRPPAPLLCTYMGRQTSANGHHPFRFFLNHSQATAANVFLLLYPKAPLQKLIEANPGLLRSLWQRLNNLSADEMIYQGRTYGGNLHKLEPKELANATIENFFAYGESAAAYEQLHLLESGAVYTPSIVLDGAE